MAEPVTLAVGGLLFAVRFGLMVKGKHDQARMGAELLARRLERLLPLCTDLHALLSEEQSSRSLAVCVQHIYDDVGIVMERITQLQDRKFWHLWKDADMTALMQRVSEAVADCTLSVAVIAASDRTDVLYQPVDLVLNTEMLKQGIRALAKRSETGLAELVESAQSKLEKIKPDRLTPEGQDFRKALLKVLTAPENKAAALKALTPVKSALTGDVDKIVLKATAFQKLDHSVVLRRLRSAINAVTLLLSDRASVFKRLKGQLEALLAALPEDAGDAGASAAAAAAGAAAADASASAAAAAAGPATGAAAAGASKAGAAAQLDKKRVNLALGGQVLQLTTENRQSRLRGTEDGTPAKVKFLLQDDGWFLLEVGGKYLAPASKGRMYTLSLVKKKSAAGEFWVSIRKGSVELRVLRTGWGNSFYKDPVLLNRNGWLVAARAGHPHSLRVTGSDVSSAADTIWELTRDMERASTFDAQTLGKTILPFLQQMVTVAGGLAKSIAEVEDKK